MQRVPVLADLPPHAEPLGDAGWHRTWSGHRPEEAALASRIRVAPVNPRPRQVGRQNAVQRRLARMQMLAHRAVGIGIPTAPPPACPHCRAHAAWPRRPGAAATLPRSGRAKGRNGVPSGGNSDSGWIDRFPDPECSLIPTTTAVRNDRPSACSRSATASAAGTIGAAACTVDPL
jgi:hypothetical protein